MAYLRGDDGKFHPKPLDDVKEDDKKVAEHFLKAAENWQGGQYRWKDPYAIYRQEKKEQFPPLQAGEIKREPVQHDPYYGIDRDLIDENVPVEHEPEDYYNIRVYIDSGLVYKYHVGGANSAREHADAIVKNGYRSVADGKLTVYPASRIVKVVYSGNDITTNYPDVVEGT